jgi:hypothetical protein
VREALCWPVVWALGQFKLGGEWPQAGAVQDEPHDSSELGPVNLFSSIQIFSNKQSCSNLENTKLLLIDLQKFPNFERS